MQKWDDGVAAAPPAIKREALRVRGAVAQLWSRFPYEYHSAFARPRPAQGSAYDILIDLANMTCDILWYLHNTVEAANLVQRPTHAFVPLLCVSVRCCCLCACCLGYLEQGHGCATA